MDSDRPYRWYKQKDLRNNEYGAAFTHAILVLAPRSMSETLSHVPKYAFGRLAGVHHEVRISFSGISA